MTIASRHYVWLITVRRFVAFQAACKSHSTFVLLPGCVLVCGSVCEHPCMSQLLSRAGRYRCVTLANYQQSQMVPCLWFRVTFCSAHGKPLYDGKYQARQLWADLAHLCCCTQAFGDCGWERRTSLHLGCLVTFPIPMHGSVGTPFLAMINACMYVLVRDGVFSLV